MVSAENKIQGFIHCKSCMSAKPKNKSPADWSKLECGWTENGLQIRCRRCDLNIIHIDFEGQKHPANTAGKDPSHGSLPNTVN